MEALLLNVPFFAFDWSALDLVTTHPYGLRSMTDGIPAPSVWQSVTASLRSSS